MKLVASVIIRDEYDRYLVPFLNHLLDFCDEVRILDDGSTDGWADKLALDIALQKKREVPGIDLAADSIDRIHVARSEQSAFFAHEGNARQALLHWTMVGEPTHVLAIDADEFVADGPWLRRRLERALNVPVWSLQMEEVWRAEEECLCVRHDGGWRPHPVPILYRVPRDWRTDPLWQIRDVALACGRAPLSVTRVGRIRRSATAVLHFGWANEEDRQARFDRYVEHDGGKYHASKHIESIMWPDSHVRLTGRDWPAGLDRAFLFERANRRRDDGTQVGRVAEGPEPQPPQKGGPSEGGAPREAGRVRGADPAA